MPDGDNLILDVAEAAQRKRASLRRFHTQTSVRARMIGTALTVVLVGAHNTLIFGEVGRTALIFAWIVLVYGAASTLLLRSKYVAHRVVETGEALLFVDIFLFLGAIHASGAEQSMLFPIIFIRAFDHLARGRRRFLRMLFASGFSYMAMVALWLALGREVDLRIEFAKVVATLLVGLYFAEVAKAIERSRRKTRKAMDLARAKSIEAAEHAKLAEAASESKGRFLSIMSHELRTPLNGIVGAISLIRQGADQGKALAIAERSSDGLLALINDLLDVASIDEELHLSSHSFRPAAVIEIARELVAESADRKGIEIEVEIDRDCAGPYFGDSIRLIQVFDHVLANAVKFSEGGKVSLRLSVLEQDADASTLQAVVEDEGCGIEPDQLERIFEPFVIRDDSANRRHQGAGLGLAVSRRIVRAMGGEIEVESVPGQGSRFTLTFEVAKRDIRQ